MDTLQLIAEPTRRAILESVWARELTAGEIADQFDTTFGAVSQHLTKLRSAGLVTVRRDGNRRWYRANHTTLAPYRGMLEAMWRAKLDQLAAAVESTARDGAR